MPRATLCPRFRVCLPRFTALLAAIMGLSHCGQRDGEDAAGAPASGSAPVKIQTTTVKRQAFADEVEALGTVRALEAIEISSTVTERVKELKFEDGDAVKEGDLLVVLDSNEENAMLEVAKAQQAEQEREIKRLGDLVSEGAVSEVRLEEYHTQRDIARQRVEEAQAQIDDRRIVAPFDGVLGFRQVSPGAMVSPGGVIATLDILDPVKLDFTVPETFLGDLKTGLEIIAFTEAYPKEEFTGTVTQIDTRVNPVTRSITVRAEIPNPDHRLRPGMLMTTTMKKNPQDSLSIPERAVVSVQSNHFVFIVNKAGAAPGRNDSDGASGAGEGADPDKATTAAAPSTGHPTVTRTEVAIGRRLPGYVEITGGLEEGQTIVTDGLIGLTDGAPVEITGEFQSPAEPYHPSQYGKD